MKPVRCPLCGNTMKMDDMEKLNCEGCGSIFSLSYEGWKELDGTVRKMYHPTCKQRILDLWKKNKLVVSGEMEE
jgi:hypothetical protein